MRRLIEEHVASKKEFGKEKKKFEKTFGEFLTNVPGWRDILGSVIISNGCGLPEGLDYDHLGDILIPEIRDIDFDGKSRISFKISIPSDTWVPKYLETGWFPLEWLTDPGTSHINHEYLRGKLRRRMETLKECRDEEVDIKSHIKKLEDEISGIKRLLED